MSPKPLALLEGAIFLSDAHYSQKYPQLLSFLKAIRAQEIYVPQLVLMGDLFDLLFGSVTKTQERNREAIELINSLSDNIEILYLEGNHDFDLKTLFLGVKVFPITQQPITCHYKGLCIGLAHGDFNGPLFYKLYTASIRNPIILKGLSVLNRLGGDFILKALDKKMEAKNMCHKMSGFEAYIAQHLSASDFENYDLFIEGHHHQDLSFKSNDTLYINLPAFVCGLKYMRWVDGVMVSEVFEVV